MKEQLTCVSCERREEERTEYYLKAFKATLELLIYFWAGKALKHFSETQLKVNILTLKGQFTPK